VQLAELALVTELFGLAARRFGAAPAALAAAMLLSTTKRKKGRKR
jgi:hypothetical protein